MDKPSSATQKTTWQHLMEPLETAMRAPRMFMLSPQDRAEVLKVKITEAQATRRARIAEHGLTQRARLTSENYQIIRGMIVVLFAIMTIAGCLTLNSYVNAWHDIRSKQVVGRATPDFALPYAPVAAPSASASADVKTQP